MPVHLLIQEVVGIDHHLKALCTKNKTVSHRMFLLDYTFRFLKHKSIFVKHSFKMVLTDKYEIKIFT